MNEEPASKRRRFDDSIISSSRASVDALPDVVLQHCFSFIGSGQYRFVAGTCHNFQNIYSIDHQKQTTWRAAASSISGAKLCLEDAKKLGRDVYAILFTLSLEASKTGNIHVLEWARVQHSSYDAGPRHFQQAASFGHVGVFEWADEKGVGGWKSNIMTTINCAIDHERINILEWFLERRLLSTRVVDNALQHGKLKVLRWLEERDLLGNHPYSFSLDAQYETAYNGQIDALEFLFENGYTPDTRIIEGGIDSDRPKVLEFARENNIGWNEDACKHAASSGNLRALQWLRENDCPWDARVVQAAQRQGHADIVEWAIENGCPTELIR